MNYCRRCRKFGDFCFSTSKYCSDCHNAIGRGDGFNRYSDFKAMSFVDCYDDPDWGGFTEIKFHPDLVQTIGDRFDSLNFLVTFYHDKKFPVDSTNVVYLVSDADQNLLKVGQTSNAKSRFSRYYNISGTSPLRYDIFTTETPEEQDLHEHKVRNYLEYLGFILPSDNSGKRLKYIL